MLVHCILYIVNYKEKNNTEVGVFNIVKWLVLEHTIYSFSLNISYKIQTNYSDQCKIVEVWNLDVCVKLYIQ